MFRHNLETNYNFNFKDSKILINVQSKKHRTIVESRNISHFKTFK